METNEIRPENFYYIQGSAILKIKKLARRLYVENKLSEDEVRDLSENLQVSPTVTS